MSPCDGFEKPCRTRALPPSARPPALSSQTGQSPHPYDVQDMQDRSAPSPRGVLGYPSPATSTFTADPPGANDQ